MGVLFGGLRAASTLGSFLRSFTWENVLQLPKVHREFLAELARRTPLLPGADVLAFLDTDSQQKRVYGHAKQGAAFSGRCSSGHMPAWAPAAGLPRSVISAMRAPARATAAATRNARASRPRRCRG